MPPIWKLLGFAPQPTDITRVREINTTSLSIKMIKIHKKNNINPSQYCIELPTTEVGSIKYVLVSILTIGAKRMIGMSGEHRLRVSLRKAQERHR